ncbi:MAG: hypothetical protein LC793_24760, partial [Thermomicrobia bacterium]|nr:hypothetical protein [Thermomicrobia bacterium]
GPPTPRDNLIGLSVTSGAFAATVTDVTWTGAIGSHNASGVFVIIFTDVTHGGTPDPGSFSIRDARGNHLSPAGADVQNAAQQQYSAGGFGDALDVGTKAVFVFNAPSATRIAPASAPLPTPR